VWPTTVGIVILNKVKNPSPILSPDFDFALRNAGVADARSGAARYPSLHSVANDRKGGIDDSDAV
jgi:hypothetical protein